MVLVLPPSGYIADCHILYMCSPEYMQRKGPVQIFQRQISVLQAKLPRIVTPFRFVND